MKMFTYFYIFLLVIWCVPFGYLVAIDILAFPFNPKYELTLELSGFAIALGVCIIVGTLAEQLLNKVQENETHD